MNKSELAAVLAEKMGLSQAAAYRTLSVLLETVIETVGQGENVNLVGFGSFKPSQRAARSGTNPKTKAVIEIPAVRRPRFVPGAAFKAVVANQRME